jgi:hypothetical protein
MRMAVGRVGVGAHESLFYVTAEAETLALTRGSARCGLFIEKNGSEDPSLQKPKESESREGEIVGQFDTTSLRSD